MSDEIPYANVIRVERDRETPTGWFAYVGPSFSAGLGVYAPTPALAILKLSGQIRDKGWVLDESWTRTAGLPASPNVIVLRKLGPRDWCAWYAQGLGPNEATHTDSDPVIALCGFALRLKERHYVFDADFVFPDPLGVLSLDTPEPVTSG